MRIRKPLRSLMAITVLTGVSLAQAGEVSVGTLRAKVPSIMVSLLVSKPAESRNDFLLRAGGMMAAYTQMSGFEACGQVCVGERTGIVITTSQAQGGCAVVDRCPGANMLPIGQTIHTHPQMRHYKVTRADAILSNFKHRVGVRVSGDPGKYSDTDFEGGPGYLVTEGKLLHQQGRGTETIIGELIAPDINVVSTWLMPAR